MTGQIITATEFKATCLELFDRLAAHEIDQLVVTKRGRPVAVLVPPPVQSEDIGSLYGFLRGRATISDGLESMSPAEDESFDAEDGWGK